METAQHNQRDMDVVYLRGSLDCDTAPDLANALDNLINTSHVRLIINCRNLDYIDDTGIRVIYAAILKIRMMDGDILFACLKPEIKAVFGNEKAVPILFFDTEDAAIRSYL
jgi:anti-anti-sigma factor